jgi:tRNA threonylcarbamoyladenosine biosynthesis protein TsaE
MKVVSTEEMRCIASDFVKNLRPKEKAVVVGLKGDLGSGKTTFAQYVADILGVEETVTSPTFVIQKKYPLLEKKFKNLVHIDAYRIEDTHELEVLKWAYTISDPKNLVLIEWPERVEKIMPKDAIEIHFEHVDENTREIVIK